MYEPLLRLIAVFAAILTFAALMVFMQFDFGVGWYCTSHQDGACYQWTHRQNPATVRDGASKLTPPRRRAPMNNDA